MNVFWHLLLQNTTYACSGRVRRWNRILPEGTRTCLEHPAHFTSVASLWLRLIRWFLIYVGRRVSRCCSQSHVGQPRGRRVIQWSCELVLTASLEGSRRSRHSPAQQLKSAVHSSSDHVSDLILDIEAIAALPEDLACFLTDQRGLRQKLPACP